MKFWVVSICFFLQILPDVILLFRPYKGSGQSKFLDHFVVADAVIEFSEWFQEFSRANGFSCEETIIAHQLLCNISQPSALSADFGGDELDAYIRWQYTRIQMLFMIFVWVCVCVHVSTCGRNWGRSDQMHEVWQSTSKLGLIWRFIYAI